MDIYKDGSLENSFSDGYLVGEFESPEKVKLVYSRNGVDGGSRYGVTGVKKMKKTTKHSNSTKFICISFLLLLPLMNFGQDSIHPIAKKTLFSIQIGASYKTFTDRKFIEPANYNSYYFGDEFYDHQYERFDKIPTFGYNAGLLFSYKFSSHWSITSGIQYLLRKDKYEINPDSILSHQFSYSSIRVNCRDIHNVIKYDYANHNIELPVMIQYSYRKFAFNAGASISLLTYKKANYTYLIIQNPAYNDYWSTPDKDKTVSSFESTLLVYPTLQLSYEMQIKKVRANPYFALNYETSKQHSLYLQLGIIFPLNK